MSLKGVGTGALLLLASASTAGAADRLVFNSVPPCRIIDTRLSAAGALPGGATRMFHVVGSSSDFVAQGGHAGGCGLPGFAGPGQPQVQAVLVNFVGVTPAGAGHLTVWASDGPMPLASILNYAKVTDETLGVPLNVANGIAVPVRQDVEGNDIKINAAPSSTHVVADVVGYWRSLAQVGGSGSEIDADLLDGLDSTAFAAAVHTHPWSEITGKPAGFADDVDNDVLGGLSCATGEVAKWNGTAWACAADLTGGGATGWGLTGNAGTNPATNFLGTIDNQALELRAGNLRVLRAEPHVLSGTHQGPNVISGYEGNTVMAGVAAATVGGGGVFLGNAEANQVTGHFGFVGGGGFNRAGDLDADPVTGVFATVGGGVGNVASGNDSGVLAGQSNTASADHSAVLGGGANIAAGSYSVVVGGLGSIAGGAYAVAAGNNNGAGGDFSLAAGHRAYVRSPAQVGGGDTDGDQGTFVWADSTNVPFMSTGPDQFLIRAAGGVGINTNAPGTSLDVNGTAKMTGFRLSAAPTAGFVLTSDAAGNGTWQAAGGGDITGVIAGTGLSGGGLSGDVTLSANTSVLQSRVTGTCAPGSSIRTVNGDGSVVCQTDTTGADWTLTGNDGTNPATNFIGTTDNQALELRANNLRALRIEPRAASGTYRGPNFIAGYEGNAVTAGVNGAVIHGGGLYAGSAAPNLVTGFFGTVSGGFNNRAGDFDADPATSPLNTVGGGYINTASGGLATVGGGQGNIAGGSSATVAGGIFNQATGVSASVGGGTQNIASGDSSTVPGGAMNSAGGLFSFAAGFRAKVRDPGASGDADGDEGTFVWADRAFADFISTGPNQFLIRAEGGVAINTATPAPGNALTLNGSASTNGAINFGGTTRQMLNLWNTSYAIGVQSYTQYYRADAGAGFAWFQGGVHSDVQNDPGAGGTRQMRLDSAGNLFVRGTVNPGGADFAEMLPAEHGLEAGDVVAIGADGSLVKSGEPYQMAVAGVVSTQPGLVGGAGDGEDRTGKVPLAVVGIVPVKASAEAGPIRPGDRLVASATPGHAMRSAKEVRVGSVIGKALSSLESGTGVVRMLVVLQ